MNIHRLCVRTPGGQQNTIKDRFKVLACPLKFYARSLSALVQLLLIPVSVERRRFQSDSQKLSDWLDSSVRSNSIAALSDACLQPSC